MSAMSVKYMDSSTPDKEDESTESRPSHHHLGGKTPSNYPYTPGGPLGQKGIRKWKKSGGEKRMAEGLLAIASAFLDAPHCTLTERILAIYLQ